MWQTLRFLGRVFISGQMLKRLGVEQISRLQLRRFRRLVRFAAEHSPFYRERYAGLDLARVTPSDLPVISKREFIAEFDRIITDPAVRRADVHHFMQDPANLGKRFLGRYVVCHTSGSQGESALL